MSESESSWFSGRDLLIATMHGKETVIAPVLEAELRVVCSPAAGFDTDRFGMFSGPVKRRGSALEALRQKCDAAMKEYDTDLVVASEGSFGAHPEIGFVPCNEELLMLVDRRHDLEIVVSELSLHMHFQSSTVQSESELEAFLLSCDLPNHAVVMSIPGHPEVFKGITDPSRALEVFQDIQKLSSRVLVQSDLRAMYNPTRMEVIRKAARKLAAKMKACCTFCAKPGYGVVEVLSGLPCEDCGAPTKSAKAYVYGCRACGLTEEHPRIDKQQEYAGFCDFCNP